MFSRALSDQVRKKFHHVDNCPYQGPRIFFENAGGALTLKSVIERSSELSAIPDNQGRDNVASIEMMRIIEQGKADVLQFLGLDKGTVFAGESGTEVLFRQIRAAILSAPEGSHVLGTTLEHPGTVSACTRWARIAGLPFLRVPHNNKSGIVTVEDYREFVTPETCVATLIHTSPVTGMTVDLEAIIGFIRSVSPDCIIIIDGIQHAAHGGLDLRALDIDAYAISAYKVFSRHGYGLGWVSERLNALPHDRLIGSEDIQWELGTRDVSAYATFSKVVDYFEWLGAEFTSSENRRTRIVAAGQAIAEHENALVTATIFGTDNYTGLAGLPNVSVIGGADNVHREGLVSFIVDGIPAMEVVEVLNKARIRTHARKNDCYSGNVLGPLGLENCVRASYGHYNTVKEVEQLLKVMQKIICKG